jgi:hypothetical protein
MRKITPNLVVEWLTLLLRTTDVPRSHLGPDTGYPDWGFAYFLHFLQVNAGKCLKLSLDRFLANSSFIYNHFIRHCMI